MAKKRQSRKPSLRVLLIALCITTITIPLVLAAYVNVKLQGAKYIYPAKSAYLFSYELTQTPAKSFSGHESTYRFRITSNGRPLVNRKVRIGISHAYGIGVVDRKSDVKEEYAITDNNGYASIAHTPKFWSLLPDRGFGVYAGPVLTLEEETIRKRDLLSGLLSPKELNYSATFSVPAIYPRWLGWFIW